MKESGIMSSVSLPAKQVAEIKQFDVSVLGEGESLAEKNNEKEVI